MDSAGDSLGDLDSHQGDPRVFEDWEGENQIAQTTATTFVTSGNNGNGAVGNAAPMNSPPGGHPKSARGPSGILSKAETIDSLKAQLQTYQILRIHSALISDTGGVPLADPAIAATKKCLVNYSSSVKGNSGHGLGPAFLHSFREYANGVVADPIFASLPAQTQADWKYMTTKMNAPIHVSEWVKGFALKDMHGKIMTNVAITFCMGKSAQRDALLQYWILKKYVVRVGPPPAGPIERRLQKTLDRITSSRK
jgi:hypothetical protein